MRSTKLIKKTASNITEISISYNEDKAQAKDSLLRFKNSTTIAKISISSQYLNKKNTKRLCIGLQNNPDIKHIILSGVTLKNEHLRVKIVDSLLSLRNLRTLSLGYTIGSHIEKLSIIITNNPYIRFVEANSQLATKDIGRDLSIAYAVSQSRYLTHLSLYMNPSIEGQNALIFAHEYNKSLCTTKLSFDIRIKFSLDRGSEIQPYLNSWLAFKEGRNLECTMEELYLFIQKTYPSFKEQLMRIDCMKQSNYADSLLADIIPSPVNMLCTMNLSGVCKSFLYILDGIRLPNIDPQAISSFPITQVDVAKYALNLARKDIILPHKMTKEEFAAQCCL